METMYQQLKIYGEIYRLHKAGSGWGGVIGIQNRGTYGRNGTTLPIQMYGIRRGGNLSDRT